MNRWSFGEVVVRREVLHGRVWCGMPMYVVADDSDLLALYLPAGAPIAFVPGEWPTSNGRHPWDQGPDTCWTGHGVLQLHRPDDAYAVWVFWQGPRRRFDRWYLNLQAPYVRTDVGIDTLDHELDIVVERDGSWRYKDVDVLEVSVSRGRFSPAEANAILAEGERLGQMIDAQEPWWSNNWSFWTPSPQLTVEPTLPNGWALAQSRPSIT